MDHITANLLKTQLSDRVLWYDGDSTVSEKTMLKLLSTIGPDCMTGLFVDEMSSDIEQFNRNSPKSKHIRIKKQLRDFVHNWNIPEEYQECSVVEFVAEKLDAEYSNILFNAGQRMVRDQRVAQELKLFKELDNYDLLRALIYIINTLCERNVIWGTGRGSGTSSYVLYLIGVHDVDSVEFQLNPREFFHK